MQTRNLPDNLPTQINTLVAWGYSLLALIVIACIAIIIVTCYSNLLKKKKIVDDETSNILLAQLMKGNREYQEVNMLVRLFKEETDNQKNIELLWKLIHSTFS